MKKIAENSEEMRYEMNVQQQLYIDRKMKRKTWLLVLHEMNRIFNW